MDSYPVTDPSRLERKLFDAGLVQEVPLSEIYDVKGRTTIQRSWQDPAAVSATLDIQEPECWRNRLLSSMRGEFFACALEGCERVLDVGCGEGWPSLYLARTTREVVGLDCSAVNVDLARNTARLMRLDNVRFKVGRIEKLPFADRSFDGVCFGGNVFTYRSSPRAMLAEIRRVLRPGCVFAFEQWPVDPSQAPNERVGWFVDGGPPILHYIAGSGLYSRSYFIYFRRDCEQGNRLGDLARRPRGELSPEQRAVCERIKQEIEDGSLEGVEKIIYSGEDRSLGSDEFPALLKEAGLTEVASWALPDAVAFAKSLKADGVLGRLEGGDLIPCLKALVRSSARTSEWIHQWVTCRKGA